MILENYLEQHHNIRKQIEVINQLAADHNVEENAQQIGTEISRLAGVIKIHLSSEDKFMYPALMENPDEQVRKRASEYQKEMGDLLEIFTVFKEKYNMKHRILEHASTFETDYKKIVTALNHRMNKEEKELYRSI